MYIPWLLIYSTRYYRLSYRTYKYMCIYMYMYMYLYNVYACI